MLCPLGAAVHACKTLARNGLRVLDADLLTAGEPAVGWRPGYTAIFVGTRLLKMSYFLVDIAASA